MDASATVLCLDVGGTHIRVGRFDPGTDSVQFIQRTSTMPADGPRDASSRSAQLLGRLRKVIAGSLEPGDASVSVALAGPVSPDGHVWALPTIARSERADFDLEAVRSQLGVARLVLLNDMTAAALGLQSSTRQTFCVATVGTGLGVRLVIDGRPLIGDRGLAGEIGHVRVDFSNQSRGCDCGGVGHLGELASGRGVAAGMPEYVQHGQPTPEIDAFAFVDAFRRGDLAAKEVVQRQGTLLGRTLAPILTACGISDLVLMGGAVEAMAPDYADAVQAALDDATWDVIRKLQPPQVSVNYEASVPLLGAGRFAVSADARMSQGPIDVG